MSPWGQTTEVFGQSSYQTFGTQESEVFAHSSGTLNVTVPFGASTNVGTLRVTVPDLSYNNSAYAPTFYDNYQSTTITYDYRALVRLQYEETSDSNQNSYWSTVPFTLTTPDNPAPDINSSAHSIFLSSNSQANANINNANVIKKSQLIAQQSGYSTTNYVGSINLRNEDGDRGQQSQTHQFFKESAPSGNYRIQVELQYKYMCYYEGSQIVTGTASANNAIEFRHDLNSYTQTATPITFGTDEAEVRIGLNGVQVAGNNGAVLLGEINTSGVASIYGDALVTGRLTANTSNLSDERLKDNINPITGSLDLIDNLRPKSFRWKNNRNPHETRTDSFGFIAQEMSGSFPYLVNTVDNTVGHIDNLLTVDQMPLVALNTAGIQELMAKIDMLQTKITELETAVSSSNSGSTE